MRSASPQPLAMVADGARRTTFLHAVAFVAGFSLIFVALGASLGIAGSALQENLIWFQRVAGAGLVVLGLHLAELITIPFLRRTYQLGSGTPVGPGGPSPRGARRYARSLLVGGAFSLGWTPCVGPVLAGILALAADSASIGHGTLLLVAYAAGLGVPFLVAGAALGSSARLLRKLGPWMPYVSMISGVLLVFLGMLIFLDRVTALNEFFGFVGQADPSASGSVVGIFGFAVAFAAGLLSFISPCCLPLVPIYLGHLAGVSAEELGPAGAAGREAPGQAATTAS